MNRQSTLFSIFGHIAIFAIIFLWGMQWPFQPREISIDSVEVIDNASFEALVAQSNAAQSDAINPEPTPAPVAVEDIAPIVLEEEILVSEEPVEIEIIQDIPTPPTPAPAPTPPPPPAVPGIGDSAPRAAIAPPARPIDGQVQQAEVTPAPEVADEITALVETVVEQPAEITTPPTRDETGAAVETILGELAGDQAPDTPVSAAPDTAPIPPARVATSENNTNVETVAPDTTLDTGTAVVENTQTENTPTPAPEVSPAAPATPLLSAAPTPPARNAASLNVVTNTPVPTEPTVDELVAQVVEPSEPSVDDLVAQVAAEAEATPAPIEPSIGGNGPRTAPVPPARTGNLNVVSNAPSDADAILAQLDGSTGNTGRDLSRIEAGGIIQQIAKNWSIAPIADKSNLADLIVVIGFSVNANGALSTPITLLDPSNPNNDQLAAFQTAERAVLNSMPLNLPSDVDQNGVKWTLTFDPSNQSVGLA